MQKKFNLDYFFKEKNKFSITCFHTQTKFNLKISKEEERDEIIKEPYMIEKNGIAKIINF